MASVDSVTITLVGGPTALVELGGLRLLTDPTFDQPQVYSGTVTLTKETGPALSADRLLPIHVVLLSHDQHFDNLDHGGRALLPSISHVLTTTAGAKRLGGSVKGLAPFETATVDAPDGSRFRVTATPARHGPVGIEPISGDVIGFVVSANRDGAPALYVSGDTVWFEGVDEVARRFDIRVAILFTGSAETRGRFHLTMDSNDAIAAAHAFPRARIVAIHNEGWAHFTESQADLAKSYAALGLADRLQLLERGKPVRLPF